MLNTPFATLGPDQVLDAIEDQGFLTDLRCYALNSYENRVYQIGIEEGEPIVAKFYRPERWSEEQILEEHSFCQALADQEIPVIAPLEKDGRTLFSTAEKNKASEQGLISFALFPMRGGHPPELENDATLDTLGQQLGRIHALGKTRQFSHRPSIDPMVMGVESCEWLVDSGMIPDELLDSYIAITGHILQVIIEVFDAVAPEMIRLHGDCHRGNVLQRQANLFFVDFDDCRQGPSVQDLWMLLSGDRQQSIKQLDIILEGYRQFCEFDTRELQLIEPLRALRQVHYSYWIASRWHDPAFPKVFPWFGDTAYWSKHILDLKEQMSALQEPAIALSKT